MTCASASAKPTPQARPPRPCTSSADSTSSFLIYRLPPLRLHTPALDGTGLDQAKHAVLDREPNQNDREQTRKDFRYVELVLALKDVPAKAALPRRHAEHKFGRDQRAP